jgi:hypothetical protein
VGECGGESTFGGARRSDASIRVHAVMKHRLQEWQTRSYEQNTPSASAADADASGYVDLTSKRNTCRL